MQARKLFGSQVWVEPDDSAERIEGLFSMAEDVGLGWVRIFLMWPFIEPLPGVWEFAAYDHVFEAAVRHGIKIKATLTPNAGPWHTGTPTVLHSASGFLTEEQREKGAVYIERCVKRYAGHAGLGQWLLWNEPAEYKTRGDVAKVFWQEWLARSYGGEIQALNARWRTGYEGFGDVPFAEDVAIPRHSGSSWVSFRPWLDDWRCRSAWLNSELAWVAAKVRALDGVTPLCVNPTAILTDAVPCAADLRGQSEVVDVIGASFHPPFHFAYADRGQFPGLIASGVRRLGAVSSRVEVTEVQTGNTFESGLRPCGVTANEIARFHLAALAGGAESVTGWCFNTRRQDNETGDWALLDDADLPSVRSEVLKELVRRVEGILRVTGKWRGAEAEAVVVVEGASQAVEATAVRAGYMSQAGRRNADASEGGALLSLELLRRGVAATVGDVECAREACGKGAKLIVAAHLSSIDEGKVKKILRCVEEGATLVFDGTFARRSTDAKLHVPWPGGVAEEIGLEAAGMESRIGGWPCKVGGGMVNFVLARMVIRERANEWEAWEDFVFEDGEPCVLERRFGAGRLVCVRGLLAASTVAGRAGFFPALQGLFDGLGLVKQREAHVACVPVEAENGRVFVVLGPDGGDRGFAEMEVGVAEGRWRDLWTGTELLRDGAGRVRLAMAEGIAVLWDQSGDSGGA